MKKLIVASIVALMCSSSFAAILIEPLVGYNVTSTFQMKDKATGAKEDGKGAGPAYGGRLGYYNLGFSLGLDYLAGSADLKHTNFESDLKTSEWGGFVGYRFPILLKVYAGYVFSGTADSKYGATKQKAEFSKGTGAKLGVGWTAFPFLDFNLEYRKITWDEVKIGGSKANSDQSYSAWLLSVSIPITI
jgi:hypothetical protein